MAQQIQFIYLTQSDYDNLTPQISRIYFTSDTHRIYKGSDLYAATSFDQLNFNTIEASGITVDGKPVSVEGHTHSSSEITDLDPTSFAPSSHTHPGLSGITQSSIVKDTGTFTNLVVTNASIDATSITASDVEVYGGIQANTVSASSATFQTLTVTGEVTMSLSNVEFQNISASSLTVDGSAVSLEGHTHSASEINGLGDVISAATSGFATSKHTHNISDITGLATKVSGLTSSKVEKTNGVFTNLTVSSATFDAISIEASSVTVNGTGTFEVVSATTATFGDINVVGAATLSAANIYASTLEAYSGAFTNLTVVSASFEATRVEADRIEASEIITDSMSVTKTLKIDGKDVATQEYVQTMISQAIGQILASSY